MIEPIAETRPRTRLDHLAHHATILAALGLIGMALAQAWQVTARYALNDAPSWTEPLTLFFLSCTLSFGAAASVHERTHFSFPLLVSTLPPRWQLWFARLSALVVCAIGLLLAGGATRLALDNIDVRLAGTVLPQAAPYLPVAMGGLLMSVFSGPGLLRPDGAKP